MEQKSLHRFILIAQITLEFIFIVIIAGSVVGATGSGMCCRELPGHEWRRRTWTEGRCDENLWR